MIIVFDMDGDFADFERFKSRRKCLVDIKTEREAEKGE